MVTTLVLISLLLQAAAPKIPENAVFQAELKKEITTRRSKAGQNIQLVVSSAVAGSDGAVVIPVGAKLSGKIVTVTKRSKDDPATLSIVVDKAEWKDGSATLNAVVQQLQGVASSAEAGNCGPNLNRGGMGACGGASVNLQPPPADCTVANSAITCSKHELELGPGTLFVMRNVAAKTPGGGN